MLAGTPQVEAAVLCMPWSSLCEAVARSQQSRPGAVTAAVMQQSSGRMLRAALVMQRMNSAAIVRGACSRTTATGCYRSACCTLEARPWRSSVCSCRDRQLLQHSGLEMHTTARSALQVLRQSKLGGWPLEC
jgi:hypothetical protein